MAFIHGKKSVFKLGTVGTPAVTVDITQYLVEIAYPKTADTAETSALGGGDKTYVVGLRDRRVTLSGVWDAVIDAQLDALLGSDVPVNYDYGPQGGSAGNVKYSGTAILTSYDNTSPVGDRVGFTAELQASGAATRTTF